MQDSEEMPGSPQQFRHPKWWIVVVSINGNWPHSRDGRQDENSSHSIVDDVFEIKKNRSRGLMQNLVLPLIRASLSM
jgi:hypothetical protein